MEDVPLKYNRMDNFLILARTKNKSLTLSIDEHGLKVSAELLDTHSMTNDLKDFIEKNYSSLDSWLATTIEATINTMKNK